ncbi:hypothetical protein D3C72_1350080 [compost metagenome]
MRQPLAHRGLRGTLVLLLVLLHLGHCRVVALRHLCALDGHQSANADDCSHQPQAHGFAQAAAPQHQRPHQQHHGQHDPAATRI